MTRIESETKIIESDIGIVYKFLSNINNLEKIMPDRVENWKSSENDCYFSIKGTAELGMKIKEKTDNEAIIMESAGKVPFKFEFCMNMKSIENNKTAVMFVFDADLNPMLKLMAVNPLKNFLNILLDNLSKTEM